VRRVSDEKAPHDEISAETQAPAEQDERAADDAERPARRRTKSRNARSVAPAPQKPNSSPATLAVLIGLAAAAVGAAGGWFGHEAQAKAKLKADSVPAASGSAAPKGPCGAWQQKICAGSGDTSAACSQAKSATDLLTPSTCEVALASVPATLAKIKAERASCDTLVSRLCAELTPGSQTCAMVQQRTPSFPRERCDEMLAHYDEVIGQLKQMDQQGGAPMGGPPGHPGMPAAPGAHP
jgi:hypothetical protein